MKKLCIATLLALSLASCSSFGPKPQLLYNRTDLDTKVSKIIIFPTTDFNGKSSAGSKSLDLSINAAWAGAFGSDKVIPAGIVIEKISNKMGNDFYKKFVATLDKTSEIEQLSGNKTIKKFAGEIVGKLGEFPFALAIVSGGEAEYNAGQAVHLHIGLFDAKNLTWRLITKIEVQKGAVGNWKLASQAMISNSFDMIKKMNVTTTDSK